MMPVSNNMMSSTSLGSARAARNLLASAVFEVGLSANAEHPTISDLLLYLCAATPTNVPKSFTDSWAGSHTKHARVHANHLTIHLIIHPFACNHDVSQNWELFLHLVKQNGEALTWPLAAKTSKAHNKHMTLINLGQPPY